MAAKLFTGGTILTFDPESKALKVVRNGSLLVTGDKIAGVYEQSQSVDVPEDAEKIDVTGKIITPGFIDTHRHGWQTGFKTLGANTTLAEYFQLYGQYVPAVAENFTAEDVYLGQLTGLYEAINAGVTSTVDHAHGHWARATADAGINGSVDSGARVFWGYAIHQTPKGWPIEEQFAHFKEIVKEGKLKDTLVSLGISFDGFAMGNDDLTNQVVALAKYVENTLCWTHFFTNLMLLTNYLGSTALHFSPLTLSADLGAVSFTGCCYPYQVLPRCSNHSQPPVYNSPTLIDKFGLLRTTLPIIISHASFITKEDADLLRQTNQYISTTPESEAHYGHDNPEAALCQDQAALGVDTHVSICMFGFSQCILTAKKTYCFTYHSTFFFANLSFTGIGNHIL